MPNPGRSIILSFILPFTLFIKSADFTCCATGAIISKDRLDFITCSSIDCILRTFGISDAHIKTNGLSNSDVCFSVLVTKCGDVNPQSTCTPSAGAKPKEATNNAKK